MAEVAEARRRALEDLRWSWDEGYEILAGYTACPVPRACQKDPAE